MQIGEVIRKYRKGKNMTQEEMAKRLGVTTPAVNKWEKGVTQPDIMLLAPIARLLGITLETLLSFHEELTQEEITGLVEEVSQKFDDESYDDVFRYVSGIIQEYPNCYQLILQMAAVLNARSITDGVVNADDYDGQLLKWYQCVLESNDVKLQKNAAEMLFHYYVRKEMYDKAEEYLQYFAEEDTLRKQLQALIYSKTNRLEESYKAYEEILFSECNMLGMVFHSLFMLSAEEGKMAQAKKYLEKESSLNRLFEMGKYREISGKLEMVAQERNVEETLLIVKALLDSVESLGGFADSWLYAHMKFNKISDEFVQKVRNDLLGYFSDKEDFGYMDGNAEWEELVGSAQGLRL